MLCAGARKRQLFLAFLMFGGWGRRGGVVFVFGFFSPFLVAGVWACCHICLSVCLSHVVFLRDLQRPVAHSQLLGTEVVPCIVLTFHARVFMLE